MEELDHCREYCFPEIPPCKTTDPRPALVAALCEHRQRYFERYPEIYEDTRAALDREQIKSRIYCLDEDIVEAFRNEVVNPNL